MKSPRWLAGVWLAWLLVALLAGCGGRPREAETLWSAAVGPVVAVVTAREGDRDRVLALQPNGVTRWIDAGAPAGPGPAVGGLVTHLAVADLDGDQRDELLAAAPNAVTAYDQAGRQRWRHPLKPGQLIGLAAGDLSGNGTPQILVTGVPPVSLRALAADGQLAWEDRTVRTAYGAAAAPATAVEGAALVALDSRVVARYDAVGRAAGQWPVALGHEAGRLVPLQLGLLGDRAVLLGWADGASPALATWAITSLTGTLEQTGPAGKTPPVGRPSLFVGAFRDLGETLAAVVDANGLVTWLAATGKVAESPAPAAPVLSAGLGPRDATGRRCLLRGTPQGVEALGWR